VPLFEPNRNPKTSELRWFAGLWFPAFCLAVGLFLRRHGLPSSAMALWVAGAALAIAGLCRPATIRPVYRVMLQVTFPIGWLMSHVLLASAYFLIITPIGFAMRRSHDPMRRHLHRSAASYWIDCEPVERERYFRQT